MNACFKILIWLRLMAADSYVEEMDRVMEAAYQENSSVADYARASQTLPEFLRYLSLAPKAKVLQWVKDSPHMPGVYGTLQEVKKLRRRSP
jgi:hypothetical protein